MGITRLLSLIVILKALMSSASDLTALNTTNSSVEFDSILINFSMELRNVSNQSTNSNNSELYESVMEQVASTIEIVFTPMLIFFGISGNMISLYVFYSSKLWQQSTSQYLSALAVSDSVFLVELLLPWLDSIGISTIFNRDPYCKGFVYVSYVTCCLSSWLVIAFTFERFVAVQYPLQRTSVCTVKKARYIILSLTAVAMLVNIPVINFASSENQICHIDQEKLEQAAKFNWVDTTVTFTIPLLLIIFFNTWVAASIYRYQKERLRLIQEELLTSLGQHKGRDGDVFSRCQRRITNMLLLVSTIFVIFNCPAYIMRIWGYTYDMVSKDLDYRWLIAQNIATLLFNANFGINFFLYCFSGQNFRRALVQTVPCCGWLARKLDRDVNRSPRKQDWTCSVPTSAGGSTRIEATNKMSSVRQNARRRRHGSGKYIMRWKFDNTRQRRGAAESGAAESISMDEIISQPGPSRVLTDDRSRPGTSHTPSSGQVRADPGSRHVVIEPVYSTTDPSRPAAGSRRPVLSQVIDVKKRRTFCFRFLQLFRRSGGANRRRKDAHLYD